MSLDFSSLPQGFSNTCESGHPKVRRRFDLSLCKAGKMSYLEKVSPKYVQWGSSSYCERQGASRRFVLVGLPAASAMPLIETATNPAFKRAQATEEQMRIFFSVGEPSGDLHGANFIRGLKSQR